MATKKTEPAAEAPEITDAELDMAGEILALFDRQDDDGNYQFADEEIRHFLPMLILASGVSADMLTDEVQELMGEMAVRAGIPAGASPEERGAKLNAYYAEFPPHPDLVKAVSDFMVRHGLKDGPALPAAALAKALGTESSNRPVGGGERKEGVVPGGIMGRLQAGKALDKKKK